jgi:hypothetical protein
MRRRLIELAPPRQLDRYVAMGTSFVEIGGRGFWMQDSILELWLRLLALHVEDPSDDSPLTRRIRDSWLLASRGYFVGCVPDDLEEFVSTPEGRAIVMRAIDSLKITLAKGPELLDHHTLNLLGFAEGVRRVSGFESARLIQVADAFVDLIEGRINCDATSTAFMPGSHVAT